MERVDEVVDIKALTSGNVILELIAFANDKGLEFKFVPGDPRYYKPTDRFFMLEIWLLEDEDSEALHGLLDSFEEGEYAYGHDAFWFKTS